MFTRSDATSVDLNEMEYKTLFPVIGYVIATTYVNFYVGRRLSATSSLQSCCFNVCKSCCAQVWKEIRIMQIYNNFSHDTVCVSRSAAPIHIYYVLPGIIVYTAMVPASAD